VKHAQAELVSIKESHTFNCFSTCVNSAAYFGLTEPNMVLHMCSADTARAEELIARQQADQRAQQAATQHAEEMQKTRAALAALQKSLDLKDQVHQAAATDFQTQVVKVLDANARANDAEQARLSAVSRADQHSLYAQQANDRANSLEQQAQQAQHAAQQAQRDAQQKASRVGELERLVEQVIQWSM